MDEIRSWLYIGKYRDTLDKNYLDLKSIKAMLQLADRMEQKGINSLFLPVEDVGPTSPALIIQGMDFILAEKEKGNKVLVACGAGINRSTAFCMAALKETEGLSLLEAFKEVKRRHPASMPHEPVWESFCKYYNESTPYLDIMRLSIQNL
jgi:protein-tyrosine phosphatase